MRIVDKKAIYVAELIDRMLQGEATFMLNGFEPEDVYHQNLVTRVLKGTLQEYEKDFGKSYRHYCDNQFVMYWNIELEEWRIFRIINLVTEEE